MQVFFQILMQMLFLVKAPAFWLMAGIVYLQVRLRAKQKEEMFQITGEPVLPVVIKIILAGLLGGMLASILLAVLGVTVERTGLKWLWVLALLMMTIRQRFFCFAYAGGILSIVHLLAGWPDIDIGQLLAMVAVLHAVEGFLVLLTGHFHALPLYLKEDDGTITGGFFLQMTWPLPLIMLFVMAGSHSLPEAGFFVFPQWWPVIGNEGISGNQFYLFLPVLAALGYSDKAVHIRMEEKTRRSAGLLLVYSTLLLGMIWITEGCGYWKMLPALFAPSGHEAMFWTGCKREDAQRGYPYRAPDKGVGILDVRYGSPAAKAGLRREDVLLSLNGEVIRDRRHFFELTRTLPDVVRVEYLRKGMQRQRCMIMAGALHTGILTMPDEACLLYWTMRKDEGIIKFLHKKCEKRLKKVR